MTLLLYKYFPQNTLLNHKIILFLVGTTCKLNLLVEYNIVWCRVHVLGKTELALQSKFMFFVHKSKGSILWKLVQNSRTLCIYSRKKLYLSCMFIKFESSCLTPPQYSGLHYYILRFYIFCSTAKYLIHISMGNRPRQNQILNAPWKDKSISLTTSTNTIQEWLSFLPV